MSDVPTMTALVTFLTTAQRGRKLPPILNDGRYVPHIVVGSPDTRHAKIDEDGVIREPYQGVRFIDGPSEYEVGHSVTVTLELMYYPANAYSDCIPGATFTIREGGTVVGYGHVLVRSDWDATL
jgi:hypothetical protein